MLEQSKAKPTVPSIIFLSVSSHKVTYLDIEGGEKRRKEQWVPFFFILRMH